MGFPGHFKIAGHSGTSFKHRKAFEKIKSYQEQSKNEKTSFDEGTYKLPIKSSVQTNYQEANKQDRRMRLFFKLPVFLISVIVFSFVFVKSSKYYKNMLNARNQQEIIGFKTVQETGNLEDYIFFVNSGYYHLRRKQTSTAQSEFIRALSIDKYGKDARIGLTKTLIERCKDYHEGCEEIQANLNFIRGMKYLPEEKINELEEQFNFVVLHEVRSQRDR